MLCFCFVHFSGSWLEKEQFGVEGKRKGSDRGEIKTDLHYIRVDQHTFGQGKVIRRMKSREWHTDDS